MKKLMIILMVAALVAGGIFLVRQKKLSIAQSSVQKARASMVRVSVARKGNLSVTRSYLARVEPWRSATVGVQITSRIMEILVQEGDRVSKGQVLAILDGAELLAHVRGIEAEVLQSRLQADASAATVAALEKNLRFREREVDRDEFLAREGAIARVVAETSLDQLNETRGRLNAMEKTLRAAKELIKVRERQLEQARTRMAYTRITAPFEGVISQRLADPGDMAGSNQALVKIEDHTRFKICFDIPQSEVSSIKPGMDIVAKLDSDMDLSISRVHPSLNIDRTLTVECDTDGNLRLWAGSTLQVAVILKTFKYQILVSENSLVPLPDGGHAVFIVENSLTQALPVTVLGRDNGWVAICGVAPGTQVIKNTYLGWNRLAAGELVEVQK
jgi:RND family efflux transporter MFP subunit